MTDKDSPESEQADEVDTSPTEIDESPQALPPTFSGEQVAFLLHNFTPGTGVASTSNSSAPPEVAKPNAKGAYDHKFGWMHLVLDSDISRMNWLAVVLVAAGIFYGSGGFGNFEFGRVEPLIYWQPILMVGIGLIFVLRGVVQWKRSHLYTSRDNIVYEVKSFLPLLIMPKKIQARLPKIDSNVFERNFVEVAFRMDSGTLMLDTAAQTADQGLHKLRGVKKVDELMSDIGAS